MEPRSRVRCSHFGKRRPKLSGPAPIFTVCRAASEVNRIRVSTRHEVKRKAANTRSWSAGVLRRNGRAVRACADIDRTGLGWRRNQCPAGCRCERSEKNFPVHRVPSVRVSIASKCGLLTDTLNIFNLRCVRLTLDMLMRDERSTFIETADTSPRVASSLPGIMKTEQLFVFVVPTEQLAYSPAGALTPHFRLRGAAAAFASQS